MAAESKSTPTEPTAASDDAPEEVLYQQPSRPFEEMAKPGNPPEVDESVEEAVKAQKAAEAKRYAKKA